MSRIIFITGTGTGVGKTTLTCMLLRHLRETGVKALAMKPFCSGGKDDLNAFREIQGEELESSLLNPYYFSQPVAPAFAITAANRRITLPALLRAINAAAKKSECLLVEGAGGVLVPVTDKLMIVDLISALDCDVIVVSRNELGTLNHTLLTIEALRSRGVRRLKVVFFQTAEPDISSRNNPKWIAQSPVKIDVYTLPFQPAKATGQNKKNGGPKKFQKTLAQICGPDNFFSVVRTADKSSETKD